jgi:hypothetical protein
MVTAKETFEFEAARLKVFTFTFCGGGTAPGVTD